MQQEMIRDIERAHPKFLISVVMPDSWLQRKESERLIFTWANGLMNTQRKTILLQVS
jgi:hypothetical protein